MLLSKTLPALNIFPVLQTNRFSNPDFRHQTAYWLTGLANRALISPNYFAQDPPLLTRQTFYLKSSLPLGLLSYIESANPPADLRLTEIEYLQTQNLQEELLREANSYLFILNKTLHDKSGWQFTCPRFVINVADNIPHHGENIFDDSRVQATTQAKDAISKVQQETESKITELLNTQLNDQIVISNYAETNLTNELCSRKALEEETFDIFVPALQSDNLNSITSQPSSLVTNVRHIQVSKQTHPVLTSFYLAALKEPVPNVPGAYINQFKNLYNVLEYFMPDDGRPELPRLQEVIEKKVGKGNLARITGTFKKNFAPESLVGAPFYREEDFFGMTMKKLVPSQRSLSADIAERIYTKRNAAIHSKKTRRGRPSISISPSLANELNLDFEITLLRVMAEHVISNASILD